MFTPGQLEADKVPFTALWTGGEVQTGESLHHFPPGFGLFRGIKLLAFGLIIGYGGLEADEGTGFLQFGFGIARGHEAKVSDFDKPGRENVPHKPADELLGGGHGHQPLLTGSAIVSGPEDDLSLRQTHQPMVGDGHPVGVAAEVMVGVLGAAERPFGVDDPLFSSEFPGEALTLHRVFKTGNLALQSALTEGLLQALQKLASDDLRERPDREQEAVAGRDPSFAIRTEPPARYHQVQVGMEVEISCSGWRSGAHRAGRPTVLIPECLENQIISHLIV
ncbi:MAG: hypothetical protein QME44_10700 [Thermodesulfobacteriota bacterium]|nr:hypothetical protein [Thermodesulfobacteriota bacterium]